MPRRTRILSKSDLQELLTLAGMMSAVGNAYSAATAQEAHRYP
jgi:hypothetical protein